MTERRKIAVIGLGYVGLPLAVSFARAGFEVIGFDISRQRIAELRRHDDRTREMTAQDLACAGMELTHEEETLRGADFYIVTVPTPIDDSLSPDLTMLLSASKTVGGVLKHGDIVVYESTVYPGATEEDCVPILEAHSGLQAGRDFHVGYSPERINPGDKEHTFENIVKVVSGQDGNTLDIVAKTYGAVVKAGIHRAPSIKVAEAAKVIENTQRDLNIALMNELSLIFQRLDIDTGDVLAAAGTKWNFLRFTPGLVGGHCIGIDPYYLTHKARRLGFHAEVVLAGRRINDGMGLHVAQVCIRYLMKQGHADPRVIVLGITFKENVPDIRNSKVASIVGELTSVGLSVQVHDPEADTVEVQAAYGFPLTEYATLQPADVVILAVPHRNFVAKGWAAVGPLLRNSRGLVLDIKGVLDRSEVPPGVQLWRM